MKIFITSPTSYQIIVKNQGSNGIPGIKGIWEFQNLVGKQHPSGQRTLSPASLQQLFTCDGIAAPPRFLHGQLSILRPAQVLSGLKGKKRRGKNPTTKPEQKTAWIFSSAEFLLPTSVREEACGAVALP